MRSSATRDVRHTSTSPFLTRDRGQPPDATTRVSSDRADQPRTHRSRKRLDANGSEPHDIVSRVHAPWMHCQGSVSSRERDPERLSMLSPNVLERFPTPSPRVRPPTPVVEKIPNGEASPNTCVAWSMSPSLQPLPPGPPLRQGRRAHRASAIGRSPTRRRRSLDPARCDHRSGSRSRGPSLGRSSRPYRTRPSG